MFEFAGKHRGSAIAMRDAGNIATIVVALNNGDKEYASSTIDLWV